jgi:hypothetical protein
MKAKLQRYAKLLVALQCGAWFALTPVIPQLHQAFASHRHVYCSEHYRIEDDGPKQGKAESVDTDSVAETRIATTTDEPTYSGSRLACLFSNLIIPLTPTAIPVFGIQIPPEEREIKAAGNIEVQPVEIILFAPKNSPPEQHT